MDIAKLVMNPVRQRIMQYLLVHGRGSVKEIGKELSDVPSASLYRNVKLLAENSVIVALEENKIRGTIEYVYGLNPNWLNPGDNASMEMLIQASLIHLWQSFAKYFAGKEVDPERDMLSFSGSTLLLTDEEFLSYLMELNQLTMKYLSKEPKAGRKQRRITFISSPDI